MHKERVALVGLGRVGSIFLDVLLKQQDQAVDIVAVAEANPDTPGCRTARSLRIPVLTVAELLQRNGDLDIVFDLTGVAAVRRQLREGLAAAHNDHTVIAPESVARLIWALVVPGVELPDVHAHEGY
ncbi:conserved hypothetical protein [Thiomonas sp. X19]|uniref:homoserine dehydrogenase n=1 Tax=Thiomonas sp. X19 TaxID=1050370 RepID=UPI000B73D51D|nr:homoserine dehydrogenase [Thiomonas sp. X19]SCC95369.1 conserved hypothetical protein [Thiomonas sp. X19]